MESDTTAVDKQGARWRRWLTAAAILLLVTELILRLLGFGHPLLFAADPRWGYGPQPNQDLTLFGNRIIIDGNGMRNAPLPTSPAPDEYRVMFLGDSVTNGGASTDQSATLPSLTQFKLPSGYQKLTTLNASTGGWATANELAFLRAKGLCGSRMVVLILNEEDLYQDFAPSRVGRNINHPDHLPASALLDAVSRYLVPRIRGRGDDAVRLDRPRVPEIVAQVRRNVGEIVRFVRENGAEIRVAYVPFRTAEDKDAPLLAAMTQQLSDAKVPFLALHLPTSEFRDQQHPTVVGNKRLATQLGEWLGKRD